MDIKEALERLEDMEEDKPYIKMNIGIKYPNRRNSEESLNGYKEHNY